ncbi:hypothetical protein H7U19_13965 [Hyunsoonleella sp. SJ7]|uniref:Uncharacterized protein n=1 Tax=Hyunsoonleella aquatilis TaxID=2762758 RepID=A0A923KJ14_9FLAO|nr:hypothetical protein [Hyunsoonleella aquatilis]MBC3759519.1 hypothetical protein [Hyunsoonleella aquatilis]
MKNFTLLILLIGALSFAQNCRYHINETDDFTNEKIKETKGVSITKADVISTGIGTGASARAKARKVDNTRYLVFQLTSYEMFIVNEGGIIMLKSTSGEVIKLKFDKSVVADFSYSGDTTIWTAVCSATLDDETFNKLENAEIEKVRWYTDEGYLERDAKKKQFGNIAGILKCIK